MPSQSHKFNHTMEMEEEPQSENSCLECLRSTPCASLWGLIFCFFGAGAVGGGVIFGLRFLKELLKTDIFFPYVNYVTYGLVGATGLFVIIAYIICSISTGRNSRTIFDGSKKTKCGRATNLIILIICFFSIFLWVLLAFLLWLPVSDMVFMIIRNSKLDSKPESAKFDMSYYGLYSQNGMPLELLEADFTLGYRRILICAGVALGGALFVIIGMIQIAICTAMNYARLEELRYYEMHREESGSPSTDVQL